MPLSLTDHRLSLPEGRMKGTGASCDLKSLKVKLGIEMQARQLLFAIAANTLYSCTNLQFPKHVTLHA